MPIGAASYYIDRSRRISANALRAQLVVKHTEDPLELEGFSIEKALTDSARFILRIAPRLAELKIASQRTPSERGWLRGKPIVTFEGIEKSAVRLDKPSDAGPYMESVREYELHTQDMGPLASPDEWVGATGEAMYEALGPGRASGELLPSTDEQRERQDDRDRIFLEHYGIEPQEKDSWIDFSIRALPIAITMRLFVAGNEVSMARAAEARASRMEYSGVVRKPILAAFRPFEITKAI